MKRFLSFLLVLSLFAVPFPALADSLALLEDYAEEISIQYDEDDPSAGTFLYSWRYPHADEEAEGAANINEFYSSLIYEQEFYLEMARDAFEGYDSSTVITYTVTCSNDDYFSVLLRTESHNPDMSRVFWTGNVFSRRHGAGGKSFSLPKLLGILDPDESEEWKQDYQTEKADTLIREMVWDMIEENEEGTDYNGLTEEDLANIFFPEEHFYLDQNGDPVFYLQPSDVYPDGVPEGTELLVFPISIEDILDEL
ncbi:MAG: hypothetical protein IKE15_06635 [Clostridia bacterium]|nr:hypothetical protein [Clostridia bacterium]